MSGDGGFGGPIVLFGGIEQTVLRADTWTYLRVSGAWTPVAATGPSARKGHAMAPDGIGGVLLFGGHDLDFSSPIPSIRPLGDTWRFANGAWTQLATPGPGPRFDLAMTGLYPTGCILFGGRNAVPDDLADTWFFDASTGSWSQLPFAPGTHPSARSGHCLAMDTARVEVVLFGGASQPFDYANSRPGVRTWLGDTWRLGATGWLPGPAAGAATPPARAHAGMVEDLPHSRVLLFGGRDAGPSRSDLWAYDGQWTQLAVAAPPTARSEFGMAWEPVSGDVAVYGGVRTTTSSTTELDSTAFFSVAHAAPFGSGCPGVRGNPVLAPLASPRLGLPFFVRASNLYARSTIALLVVGTRSGQGLSLAGLGAPGCLQWVTVIDSSVFVYGGSAADVALQVPNVPALAGLSFSAQVGSFESTANALGLVVSNAIEGRIQ